MEKNKQSKFIIGGAIVLLTATIGLSHLNKDTPLDVIGNEKISEKKEIIRQVNKQEKTEGILMSRIYQVEELDSVGGEIVIVKKNNQISITKEQYNQCRENNTKQECLKQLKEQLKNQIKRDKEKKTEEIIKYEKQQINFTEEIIDQDLIID